MNALSHICCNFLVGYESGSFIERNRQRTRHPTSTSSDVPLNYFVNRTQAEYYGKVQYIHELSDIIGVLESYAYNFFRGWLKGLKLVKEFVLCLNANLHQLTCSNCLTSKSLLKVLIGLVGSTKRMHLRHGST